MGQIQFFIPMNFILCVVEVKIAIFKGFLKGKYKAADKQLLAKAIELRLADILLSDWYVHIFYRPRIKRSKPGWESTVSSVFELMVKL